MIKIAIPSNEMAILYPHFGHAPLFAIVEVNEDSKEITEVQLLHPELGGHEAVPPWLKSLGVTALIAGGLGKPAIDNLNTHCIDVFYGAPELSVKELVGLWLKNELILNPQPCNHSHDHECEHTEHHHG